jgi:hypothetical protein
LCNIGDSGSFSIIKIYRIKNPRLSRKKKRDAESVKSAGMTKKEGVIPVPKGSLRETFLSACPPSVAGNLKIAYYHIAYPLDI